MPLLRALAREAGSMKAQAVAKTLWAFAKLNRQHVFEEYAPLVRAVVREAGSMNAQIVANTLLQLQRLTVSLMRCLSCC